MSGHSHAKTVRSVKEANAKKRSQMFSKIARLISVAVREGGPNPETNSKLRLAIEMAKQVNMPKENIERIINKESGETSTENLEEFLFEAYGPGGIAILIEGITDNKNRALGEIRQTLNQNNGKLVAEGAVKWMFERKGCIAIDLKSQNLLKKEDLEMIVIEAGAEDFYWHQDFLDVYTKIEDSEKVKEFLEKEGIKIESVSLDWVPKERVEVDESIKKASQKLFEALDDLDSVQEVYSNLKT